MSFVGIPGAPNPVSFDLRNKVVKFSGNNVGTGKEHLRILIDMLNDYEVEHEDVVMKLFVHSLIEDARDWLRRLPDDSICSWSDLESLFKEQYGDDTSVGFMLNDFNNIKKNPNESAFNFNVRFQKGMYKLFQVMRLNEDVYLTTYFNAFDSKMAYELRDKAPITLRDAYKIAVNIENNRKASGKLGRRDDPKLFNSKNNNRKDVDRTPVGNKTDEPKIAQVLDLLKKMNPTTFNAHKPNIGEKAPVNNSNFNRPPKMQNYPYTTQWKDGKPVNQTQSTKDKSTIDPL